MNRPVGNQSRDETNGTRCAEYLKIAERFAANVQSSGRRSES